MRRAPILALWTKGHLPLSETDTDLPWAAMEPLVPVLWQDGKDNSGWPVVCVPPGRAAEIIVTIEVCERTGREKKLSVVRQGGGLLKVYVNPEVDEPDEWEVEGNSARLLVGTPEWLRKASVNHVRAGWRGR